MRVSHYLLAIDQGTSSSRAIIFNGKAEALAQHQLPLTLQYPKDAWVEQDPRALWEATRTCCLEVMKTLKISAKDITGIGISNQRETTIIWDRQTGDPIYPAIVWQDRRTHNLCDAFAKESFAATITAKTGLILDPYFSATKILWILNQIPGARAKAEKGELAFGTVDTYLLWQLTKGNVHATDASNAARTLLFNIHTQTWDAELLKAFDIPASLLPEVRNSADDFGVTHAFGGAIPIAAVLGDQQAALVGQACFEPGMMKVTYGTGGFVVLNTGTTVVHSQNRLLSTVAYRLNGLTHYALEGSFFAAGTTIKWLRDSLKIIHSADESESLAAGLTDNGGVYLVPAFSGLGAPYWDPLARAAILGLTGSSQPAHIVRAALEAVCYQTKDLWDCITKDATLGTTLKVDGGMSANLWMLQFLADTLNVNVQRPQCIETSALGAAFFAGLQTGVYTSLQEIAALWSAKVNLQPRAPNTNAYQAWLTAVNRVLAS